MSTILRQNMAEFLRETFLIIQGVGLNHHLIISSSILNEFCPTNLWAYDVKSTVHILQTLFSF